MSELSVQLGTHFSIFKKGSSVVIVKYPKGIYDIGREYTQRLYSKFYLRNLQ